MGSSSGDRHHRQLDVESHALEPNNRPPIQRRQAPDNDATHNHNNYNTHHKIDDGGTTVNQNDDDHDVDFDEDDADINANVDGERDRDEMWMTAAQDAALWQSLESHM